MQVVFFLTVYSQLLNSHKPAYTVIFVNDIVAFFDVGKAFYLLSVLTLYSLFSFFVSDSGKYIRIRDPYLPAFGEVNAGGQLARLYRYLSFKSLS